ncbi:hypothetical protein GCM10025795_41090 [Verticiella sediminum]
MDTRLPGWRAEACLPIKAEKGCRGPSIAATDGAPLRAGVRHARTPATGVTVCKNDTLATPGLEASAWRYF